jgi:hypothetical protein
MGHRVFHVVAAARHDGVERPTQLDGLIVRARIVCELLSSDSPFVIRPSWRPGLRRPDNQDGVYPLSASYRSRGFSRAMYRSALAALSVASMLT